ncbi:MAG: hypothetical protein J6X18_00440 [Bacteroidales bacterium]|nr:hypothetical protein [Bacteroidales bacterium]
MSEHIKLIDKPEVHAVLNEGARAIDKHLYTYLKEEFCISDEVLELCSRIEKYVHDNAKDFAKTKNGGYIYKSFDFKGKQTEVTYYIFHCKNAEEEKELITTNEQASNAFSVYIDGGAMMLITVPVVFVDGVLDTRKLYDDMQHEASHIYQQECSGHTYKESEYNFATKSLYSSNECEKQLARIVYLCHPTEQDAFVNGLYGYVIQALKQHKLPIDKDKISAYQELKNLYAAYDFVQRNRDTDAMAQAIKNMQQNGVNWKIKKYLQRASEGIKEFERKIFRVLMKCQNDARFLGYNVRSRIPNIWLL